MPTRSTFREERFHHGSMSYQASVRWSGVSQWLCTSLWVLSVWLPVSASRANPTGCPVTMSAASICSSEQAQAHTQCRYPQGSCACTLVPPCNGAVRNPSPGAALDYHWVCLPADCPSDPERQAGKACRTPGKVCTYGSCPQVSYRCGEGGWAVDDIGSLPPSSAASVGPMPTQAGGSPIQSETPRVQPSSASPGAKEHPTSKPAWRVCPSHSSFTCQPVQQGVAASEHRPPPKVCGCPPRCQSGYRLMASLSGQTWPDGSEKAQYICVPPNAGSPPSVARPNSL